jgi:hypothetical protein
MVLLDWESDKMMMLIFPVLRATGQLPYKLSIENEWPRKDNPTTENQIKGTF